MDTLTHQVTILVKVYLDYLQIHDIFDRLSIAFLGILTGEEELRKK
jgi:hypothetical protein